MGRIERILPVECQGLDVLTARPPDREEELYGAGHVVHGEGRPPVGEGQCLSPHLFVNVEDR